MENIHIRLESNEALLAKKEILCVQINALETLKAFKNYKITRKRELIIRSKFKQSLLELFQSVQETLKNLPSEKEESEDLKILERISKKKLRNSNKKAEIAGKKEYRDLEKELQEIKEKLARLG